jgi:hypothetical protein
MHLQPTSIVEGTSFVRSGNALAQRGGIAVNASPPSGLVVPAPCDLKKKKKEEEKKRDKKEK